MKRSIPLKIKLFQYHIHFFSSNPSLSSASLSPLCWGPHISSLGLWHWCFISCDNLTLLLWGPQVASIGIRAAVLDLGVWHHLQPSVAYWLRKQWPFLLGRESWCFPCLVDGVNVYFGERFEKSRLRGLIATSAKEILPIRVSGLVGERSPSWASRPRL